MDGPGPTYRNTALALMVRNGGDYSAIVEIGRKDPWMVQGPPREIDHQRCQIWKGGDYSAIVEIAARNHR